jgi:HEAT repeat protein
VFEEPGSLADEDEVRFLSQCFQQIVYSNLDQDNRRKTHRTVAEVAERLAGDKAAKVLGPLAYHFERSDDAAKGEFYRQRVQQLSGQLFSAAEIARELGLKVGDVEAVRPLDERTWPIADRFLRALTVAIKNMRVYPAGSQIVVHNAAAAKARLLELLERVEAVTFAEETQALQINGEPVESIGLVPVAQDLLRVYADHGIRRITLERGMTEADVMGLLKILSGSPQGIQHDVAYWENRLKSARIGHVRVFPVIFLAAGEGQTIWRREEKDAQLDDRTLALVRDALRALAAAVDNIRLYPPESELITLSLDQLERQAQALFTRIPSLTVGMAEGTIVVNATRPNPRLFGITIEILDRLMEDGGLTSVTIRRGVSREDLRVFLTNLSQPPPEAKGGPAFWRSVLEGRGIVTIEVGARTYAAAARVEEAQLPEPETPLSPESVTPPAPQASEAERMLELAARWLKDPLEVFLEPQVQEELAAVLGGLRRLGREDVATQLIGRTAGALREPDAKVRRSAAQGLSDCMARMDDDNRLWLLAKILDPLCGAVRRETQREAFQAEVALATEILIRLLGAGDFASAARLGEALGGPLQSLGPDAEWFIGVVRGLVDALTASGVIETVLKALKDPEADRRQQAGAILGGLGIAAVPLLLQVTLEEKDEEIYRAAAALLRAQGETSVRPLTQELERSPAVERVTRIVAVLDVILPALGNEFLFLLGHPEVEVRAEMARTLSRLPREQAVRFLGHALGQRKSEVVLGALECIRGLRVVEVLDSVVRLLENPPSDHLQRAACLCLGGLKDARAVPPLLEILGRRPRFFGLVKGLPEAIRASAARSLGELHFPEAKEALQRGLKDRSKTVRSASRLALLRLGQELEAKPKS